LRYPFVLPEGWLDARIVFTAFALKAMAKTFFRSTRQLEMPPVATVETPRQATP
jgi:hypothetical protein